MLRKDYFADRIYRDDLDGIDKQPTLISSKTPDISIGDMERIQGFPTPRPIIVRQPPLITTTKGGFIDVGKVISPVTGGKGVGEAGDLSLEAKGKKFSIYIIISAVIIVGIIAFRR